LYCIVLYGMVWYGMAWHGIALHCIVLCNSAVHCQIISKVDMMMHYGTPEAAELLKSTSSQKRWPTVGQKVQNFLSFFYPSHLWGTLVSKWNNSTVECRINWPTSSHNSVQNSVYLFLMSIRLLKTC